MSAEAFLDYGALGLAGLISISSIALARWAMGKAARMMGDALDIMKEIAQIAKGGEEK